MTDIKWPEGAEAKIDSGYTKWVDGVEYNLEDGEWVKNHNSWSLDEFKESGNFTIIERPIDAPYMPEVGECEYQLEDGPWDKCFFIGKSKDGRFVYEIRHCLLARSDLVKFRPIKSEREKFIKKSLETTSIDSATDEAHYVEIFGKMWDDGFKAPE